MKYNKIFLLLLFVSFWANAQKTFINSDFAIRDFFIELDSVYYIEKRNVKNFDINTQKVSPEGYFIGGYGLKIFDDVENNQIITVSNEFEKTVSSIRFYDKYSKKVENVFYYKKGKAINTLIIKEYKYAVLSMNNNRIIVVDYSAKPFFKIVHDIVLNSFSRDLYYQDNTLFYATDLGNIYTYNFLTKKNKLLLSNGELITNLTPYGNNIIFTTINGGILKYNTCNKTVLDTKIQNNYILNAILDENKLICGTFNGSIIVLSTENMKIISELNYHKRSVLKITKDNENNYYSSSIDKTLKKWKIE